MAATMLVAGCTGEGDERAKGALALASELSSTEINGGFENGTGILPAGWTCRPAESCRAVSQPSRSPGGAVALRGRSTLLSDPVETRVGDALDLEVWVRASGEPSRPPALRVLGCAAEDGAQPACEEWTPVGRSWPASTKIATDGWTPLRAYSVLIGDDVRRVRLALEVPAADPDVELFVDDFALRTVSLADYVESNAESERLPDLVILGVDALRQSALPIYGPAGAVTPHIERLAAEGLTFRQVTSASDWTKPSFASVMTSVYPSQHRAELHGSELGEEVWTLAEALRQRGYFTAGFVSSQPDGFLGADKGHAQGFDLYVHISNEDRLAEALDRYLANHLESLRGIGGGGLFLFYHVMAPHTPWLNPRPEEVTNDGLLGTVDINDPDHLTPIRREDLDKEHFVFGRDFNDQDIAYMRRLYELEVEKTDHLVGRLLDRFREAALDEDLNVILFSDHGESFGENGRHFTRNGLWGHRNGYQANLQTPLVLRLPGRLPAGELDEETLVSNLDVMPTLLDLAGVELPDHLEGRSLLRPPGDAPTAQFGISEDRYKGYLTIRDRRFKLLVREAGLPNRSGYNLDPEQAVYELYDLEADPDEQQEVSRRYRSEFRRLRQELLAHCARVGILDTWPEGEGADELSEETRNQLRALGYLD